MIDSDLSLQPRCFSATPAFWLAMFTASAFGTNLGDFPADVLGLGWLPSLAVLAAICLACIWSDRSARGGNDWAYWVAIVALRAGATIVGDLLTHQLALGYTAASVITGVLTLGFALLTRAAPGRQGSPLIDGRYWLAMAAAGVFGTVLGDQTAHAVGLYAAAGGLGAVLVGVIAARVRLLGAATIGYWIVVMVERTAATPFGDALASRRGLHLGLPVAMACTFALFLAALLLLHRTRAQPQAA